MSNIVLAAGGDDEYQISRSVRLRSSASAHLTRTPASAGNRNTWTWSSWVKRGTLGVGQTIFAGYPSSTVYAYIGFTSSDQIRYASTNSGASLTTTAVYRDPSAWYHIVFVYDDTQATSSNRLKLYVNGQQVTIFGSASYPTLNFGDYINSANVHNLGRFPSGVEYVDGYLTDVNFIDGQALTPSSFGETDAVTGVWKAKKYLGTYGTNGFYLPFSDNSSTAALGFDRRTSFDSYNLTGYNGAALTTSVVKYGTAALALGSAGSRYVNSNGSYGNHTPDHNIYNKNFTIEFWWRGQASDFNFGSIDGVLSGYNYLLGKGRVNTASYGWGIHVYSGGSIGFEEFTGGSGGSVSTSGVNILDNAWHHFAFTRSGSTTSIYVDGVLRATGTLNGNTDNTYGISINAMWDYTNGNLLTYFGGGTMDDLRFYNGVTKYTGAFTPPAAALPIGEADPFWPYVVLAMPMDGTNGATAIPVHASNRWTTNNISLTAGSTYDSMLDVPTMWADGGNGRGNYAVLNPLASPSTTLSNANLTVATAVSGSNYATGTIAIPASGKWYWEYVGTSNGNEAFCGIINSTLAKVVAYYGASGIKWIDGASSAYGATYTNNDVIGVGVDADANTVTFYKNNTSQGAISYSLVGETFFPYFTDGSSSASATIQVNFGQRPFAYTPPTGFKALNTQNLPDATIKKGNAYFDATLYTGTNATQTVTNAGGFQPDLVWGKSRSQIRNHNLYDSVRGAGNMLLSNGTNAELTGGELSAFTSNGFTLGTNVYQMNPSGDSMVAWQWKESVSAGFDIVTYTGTGSATTIAHSLGVAPKMIIVKSRSSAGRNWIVYHTSLGATQGIQLNLTGAASTVTGFWNNTAPTSSVFTVGGSPSSGYDDVNLSAATYVAYLFAEVAGFSKFGSYTGNGSTDGPFVYTGFRPRYVMLKVTSNSSYYWMIKDTVRDTYNASTKELYANVSDAEYTASGYDIDFVSNGFKIRSNGNALNGSGDTIIYAAFAENPFKNSLAR